MPQSTDVVVNQVADRKAVKEAAKIVDDFYEALADRYTRKANELSVGAGEITEEQRRDLQDMVLNGESALQNLKIVLEAWSFQLTKLNKRRKIHRGVFEACCCSLVFIVITWFAIAFNRHSEEDPQNLKLHMGFGSVVLVLVSLAIVSGTYWSSSDTKTIITGVEVDCKEDVVKQIGDAVTVFKHLLGPQPDTEDLAAPENV